MDLGVGLTMVAIIATFLGNDAKIKPKVCVIRVFFGTLVAASCVFGLFYPIDNIFDLEFL